MPDPDEPRPTPGPPMSFHASPQLLADLAAFWGVDRVEAAELIAQTVQVDTAALITGWASPAAALASPAVTGPTPTREQHHGDLERMDAADVVGTDTLTVMAVLRDIADTEPLAELVGVDGSTYGQECAMCKADALTRGESHIEQARQHSMAVHRGETPPALPAYPANPGEMLPVEHLISCPWVRVTHIVGVKADGGPRLYPDVEVSTDAGRTWSPFPLAPLASLRLTVSDGQVHDDGRGHLYRAVGSTGDPATPAVHRSVPKGGPRHG